MTTSDTTQTYRTRVTEFLTKRGITYSAVFVPQSQSCNRDEAEPSINWKVCFNRGRNGKPFTTDFNQGIGNVPGWKPRNGRETINDHAERTERERLAKEEGTYRVGAYGRYQPLDPPDAASVLHCLIMDASVLDCDGFEDWCREFGYDTDSRTAEATYRTCIEVALGVRALFGDDGIQELRVILEDY